MAKVAGKELTWATVDVDDPEEMAAFHRHEESKANERIKKAVKRLHAHADGPQVWQNPPWSLGPKGGT